MSNQHHYLVIGAGLSGLSVSSCLIERGAKITLVDNGYNHCSRIAAGMINPLVFRRMTKSWRVDEFVPSLKSYYSNFEQKTGKRFFYPIQIRRMFSNEHERDLWLKKQERDDFQQYMYKVTKEDEEYDRALNPFGSGRVKNGFYVDAEMFMSEMKNWIAQHGELVSEEFEYSALNKNSYRGHTYTGVIFCEGYLVSANPWFGSLPINPTKGEMLTIKSETIPEDESVNRKCFILPLGNKLFRTGSTHEWENTSIEITKSGRDDILEKVGYITPDPVQVVDQEAGVRPTILDRRPVIGTHPNHASYHIFNGLGTKGYMLAPLLANEFVDFLLDDRPIDKEVDIQRFL